MEGLRRLFHKHEWVYYGYTPYTSKNVPHGARLRVCAKCGERQTSW